MMQGSTLSAPQLGDLVRNASSKHQGDWPRISVWHGSADRTVHPGNGDAIVRQWLDLHGLPLAAMSKADVDGYPREVWWNADGQTLVGSYSITDMAHGTPLGLAGNDERYGVEGAFLIEAGISSSYHIAEFFGLTDQRPSAADRADRGAARAGGHDLDDDTGACGSARAGGRPAAAGRQRSKPGSRASRGATASTSAVSSRGH